MKRVLTIVAIVIGVLLLAVLALPLLIDANQFKPQLEARLSAALQRQVTIGDLSLALFSGGVAVRDVTIAGAPGSLEPLLRAKSITAGVNMRELIFSRRLVVRSIAIDEPQIVLVDSPSRARPVRADAQAQPTEASTTAPSSGTPLNLSIDHIEISDGRVSLTTVSGAKPIQLQNVDLDVRNFTPGSPFPVTLSTDVASGGSIRVEGTAGPVQPTALGETPFDAKVQVADLDLGQSGFFTPASGIAGLLTLDGTASADGRSIGTSGTITVKDLKLAAKGTPATKPAALDFKMTHNNEARRGTIEDGKLRLGTAAAEKRGIR